MANILKDDRIGAFLTIAVLMIFGGGISGFKFIEDVGITILALFGVCFWAIWFWAKYLRGGI